MFEINDQGVRFGGRRSEEQHEVSTGQGIDIFEAASFARHGMGRTFVQFAPVDIAFSAITAPRGKSGAHAAGALMTQAVTLGFGGLAMGAAALLGGPATLTAFAATMVMDPIVRQDTMRFAERIADIGPSSRRLQFGGRYEDNEVAYTMRQRAAQELGGSLLNARRYLGAEAALMHQ